MLCFVKRKFHVTTGQPDLKKQLVKTFTKADDWLIITGIMKNTEQPKGQKSNHFHCK